MELSNEQNKAKENKPKQQEQELITDFSQMFKAKGFTKKPPKLGSRQPQQPPKWLLQVPVKLQLTKQQMCQRKVLDQRRWMSIAKANQEQHRIVAAVVSSWNFLFSNKGSGQLAPLSVKKGIQILETSKVNYLPENQGKSSDIALKCFEQICKEFKVQAQSSIFYKPQFPEKTQKTEEQTLNELFSGLKGDKSSYILTTYNNILCPIGFDITPLVPLDAYKKLEDISPEYTQLWIISGSTLRKEGPFVSKRWKHIKQSLQTPWPYYIDLDQPKKGPLKHPEATEQNEQEARGCQFCVIQFKKDS